MVKESKRTNLNKLLRNIHNIERNYINVDNKLLETIIKDDMTSFMEVAGKNSNDEFLVAILPEYNEFTSQLFDNIKQNNQSRIEKLMKEKKDTSLLPFRKTIKRKTIPLGKPTIDKPQQLKSFKNNRQKWSKKEERKIKILLKSGKKPKIIATKINKLRLKDDNVFRTKSSINNKIYQIKQKQKVKK